MLKATIKEILGYSVGSQVEVDGWVRSLRQSKSVSFINLNDGSTVSGIQAVLPASFSDQLSDVDTGAALSLTGLLSASPGKGQQLELQVEKLQILGLCPAADYPLQKKRHSYEFLRSIEHLRGRSNTLSAIMRMRSELSLLIHDFFRQRGFYYLHTPIIANSDAEGGGECFEVKAPSDSPGQHFFGSPGYLTVSGQLEGEAYAQALGRIYTFGPTFRAENSHTVRHLAEFWMVEPELSFCSFIELQDLAIDFIRTVSAGIWQNCAAEIELFDRWVEPGLQQLLADLPRAEYHRISYREALKIFAGTNCQFDYQPDWNAQGLQTEHERFLAEEVFNGPVLVYDYPAAGKAFYMKQNDDGESVAGMDLLLPRLGEVIGGSMREDNYEKLLARMVADQMDIASYQWYLDLRKFGSVPHGGFGLGLERLLMYLSGMKNIRDVIPFPRCPA